MISLRVCVTVQSMVLFTGPRGRLFRPNVELCTDVTPEMLRSPEVSFFSVMCYKHVNSKFGMEYSNDHFLDILSRLLIMCLLSPCPRATCSVGNRS